MKNDNIVFKTTGTKSGQITLLTISVLFFSVSLATLYSQITFSNVLFEFFICGLFAFINFLFRNHFDVYITTETIILSNMWNKKNLSILLIDKIEQPFFIFFNPYLKIFFVDKKSIWTVLPDYKKFFYNDADLNKLISGINETILNLKSKSMNSESDYHV